MGVSKICRLCAKPNSMYVPLFEDEGLNLDLPSKICHCLQIKVCLNDNFPTVVCSDCCQKLMDTSEFLKQATNAQFVLKSLLKGEDCFTTVENKTLKGQRESTKVVQKDGVCSTAAVNRELGLESVTYPYCSKKYPGAANKKRLCLDSNYSWLCTDCSCIFENRRKLEQHHKTVHQQLAKYQCYECSKIYTAYKKFSRHVRSHRNQGKFSCEKCMKGFSTKQSLEVHKILHSDARPFVCRECGRSFRQVSTLHCHQRIHAPDHGTFVCPHCKKMMSTQKALQYHVLSHNGSQYFTCEICGKSFTRKQTLVRHILIHSDQTMTCHMCCKRFKTQQQLQSHLHVHSDERQHQCDVCGKQFRLRSSLCAHSRIHTGEMPYACEFCGQRFRFRGVYVIHRRKHTGERPYLCAVCGWTFSNYANHAKHMKWQHHQKTPEDQLQLLINSAVTPQASISFPVPIT